MTARDGRKEQKPGIGKCLHLRLCLFGALFSILLCDPSHLPALLSWRLGLLLSDLPII